MEYIGTKRSLTITISKYFNGVLATGYPKTYYGNNAFISPAPAVSFPTLSHMAEAQLTDEAFLIRYNELLRYIESLESKLDFDIAIFDNSSEAAGNAIVADPLCFSTIQPQP